MAFLDISMDGRLYKLHFLAVPAYMSFAHMLLLFVNYIFSAKCKFSNHKHDFDYNIKHGENWDSDISTFLKNR